MTEKIRKGSSELSQNELPKWMSNLAILGIVAVGIYILKPFWNSIILAFVISYILYPLVSLLKKFLKSYVLSLILTIMILLIPAGLFLSIAAQGSGPIIEGVRSFTGEISGLIEGLKVKLNQNTVLQSLNLADSLDSVKALVDSVGESLRMSIINMVKNLPMVLLNVLVFLLTSFFFIKEVNHIVRRIMRWVNTLDKRSSKILTTIIEGIRSGLDLLFVSYITTSIITIILAWMGYTLFDVPFAFILAVITGIFAFLPILGGWMIYGGASIYLYSIGLQLNALLMLLYGIIVINLIPEVWIRPVIGSRKANVHPATILLGFFSGPLAFGVIGFILGPMILVIVEKIIIAYINGEFD